MTINTCTQDLTFLTFDLPSSWKEKEMENFIHIVAVLVHLSTGQQTTLTNSNMWFEEMPQCITYTQQNKDMIAASLYQYLETEFGQEQPWRIEGLLCATREFIQDELGPPTDKPELDGIFLSA